MPENYFPDELSGFVRGPRRSDWESNLEEFESVRAAALVVPCPHCRQPAGSVCLNPITKTPLKRFPAHCPRIKEAARKATA